MSNNKCSSDPSVFLQFEKQITLDQLELKHIDYVLVFSNTKQNKKQKENKKIYLHNLVINGLKLDFKVNTK